MGDGEWQGGHGSTHSHLGNLMNGATVTLSLLVVPVQLEIVLLHGAFPEVLVTFPDQEGVQEANSQPLSCADRCGTAGQPRAELWNPCRPNTSKLFEEQGTQTKYLILRP
jgi:hypothetical protein